MLTINPIVSARSRQVIRGTILGGSSIVKPTKGRNSYLAMRCKNPLWLEFKARELTVFASSAPFTQEKTYRWHSMCYPLFEQFRQEFYVDGKRCLQLKSLDPLQDIGLGIWFRDCAHVKNKKVVFNTHIWAEEGTQIISEYFSLLGYRPVIFRERKCFRIKLDDDSSQEFLKLVLPHLPDL